MAKTRPTREEKAEDPGPTVVEDDVRKVEEAPTKEDEFRADIISTCANDDKPAVVKTSDPRASTVYYCAECGTASQQEIVPISST